MLDILIRVILPLILMAGAGFLIQKTVRLDIRTLSKLNVNLLVPCFLFDKFYNLDLDFGSTRTAVFYTWAIMLALLVVSLVIARSLGFPRPLTVAFAVSAIFYNSGNYGLSVMELTFGRGSPAMELQAVVLTTQNITNFTIGVFFIASGSRSVRDSLLSAIRYPIIPGFLLAVVLRQLDVALPAFILTPIERISLALVPMGLITLGAQIGTVERIEKWVPLAFSSFVRLLVAPALGLLFIKLFGLTGLVAQVLLISCAAPTAVNTALLSIEFKNESDFASQAVLCSTIVSILTMSAVIYFARTMF